MKELSIPIKGMHCKSCEVLITEELESLPDVQKANVSLRTKTATIYCKKLPPSNVIQRAVRAAGYEIGVEYKPFMSNSRLVYKDIGIGLLVITMLFIIFNAFGLNKLVNVNTSGTSAGFMALIIGVTAGFSTCMAMIGGLVLGISSRHAEKHPTATPIQKFRPHLFFNLGRVVSFTVLGAIIGTLGSAFQLKGGLLGLLTIAVGIVMLLLGLQLTELFPRLKGSLTLPSSIGKLIGIKKHGSREYSHVDSFLLGGATFFLPCGFTQAMQLLAVSTGSPVSGALIMGAFALGTAPGLLGIGGLTSIVKGAFARRFFRVIGVTIVAMALINFSNGYNLMGLGSIFSSKSASTSSTSNLPAAKLTTTYTLDGDIKPSVFTAKVNQKTTLEVDVKDDGQGCMSTIMIPGLDDTPQYLKKDEKITLTFTPTSVGTFTITCAMGVPRGTLKVEV